MNIWNGSPQRELTTNTLSGKLGADHPARITLEHTAPRKRIGVVGYLTAEAEGDASEPGDVQCGIPGNDHPGTELHADALRSTDPALRWEVRGRRHAAFTTDFDYRSGPDGTVASGL